MWTPYTLTINVLLFAILYIPGCTKQINNPLVKDYTTQKTEAVTATVMQEYFITPNTTDPAITTALSEHFVSVKEGAQLRNVLYVFFPGTYRNPRVCRATTRKAASLGFHSIGLMYDNRVAGNPLCKATGDITCHRRARLEVVDGVDRHPSVNVNTANSVINRLTKLLIYLNKTRPTQGWGQYLLNGKPNWGKIMFAGHSQGGAIAGVIGRHYPVKKVIMISMIDLLDNGKIPDWELMTFNKDRFYHITNIYDELVPYAKVKVTWTAMGMGLYGPRVNVDYTLPPYGNTHTLITARTPNTTLVDKYHNGTGVDGYIPKYSSGQYVYDIAWEYLLTK